MSEPNLIEKADAQHAGLDDLMRLNPNITAVHEGDPEPHRRRSSVRLEFYGRDSMEKMHKALDAVHRAFGLNPVSRA